MNNTVMTDAEIVAKSKENLILFYKDELIAISKGDTPATHLTLAVRRRLRYYEVLIGWTGKHRVSPEVIEQLTREDKDETPKSAV